MVPKMKPQYEFISINSKRIGKIILIIVSLLLFLFVSSSILASSSLQFRLKNETLANVVEKIDSKNLYQLMGFENALLVEPLEEKISLQGVVGTLFSYTTSVTLDDPRSLLGREIPMFSFYNQRILLAGQGTNYTNLPIESNVPLEVLLAEQEATLQNYEETNVPKEPVQNPVVTTGDKKVVYLYFTHNRESFLPYLEGVTDPNKAYHTKINVTNIGDMLKEALEVKGIGTQVDKTDIQKILADKGLKYYQSYAESKKVIEAALTANRDITYLFDIHRDSRRYKDTMIEINGTKYARLAFVIGLENPNYEKNLALAEKIHHLLEKKYPGLSRGILPQQGAGINGVYNQDVSSNALLIEFGGVDNTLEELNMSAKALADIFSENYWQAEEVNAQGE